MAPQQGMGLRAEWNARAGIDNRDRASAYRKIIKELIGYSDIESSAASAAGVAPYKIE